MNFNEVLVSFGMNRSQINMRRVTCYPLSLLFLPKAIKSLHYLTDKTIAKDYTEHFLFPYRIECIEGLENPDPSNGLSPQA